MFFTLPAHDPTHQGRQTLRGPKTLFENLDWLVTPNERAGIVGSNGTGKSTLPKIVAGMESLDAGSIVTMKGASVGYLPQEGLSLSGRTVFADLLDEALMDEPIQKRPRERREPPPHAHAAGGNRQRRSIARRMGAPGSTSG
ncbi:MAG: ATP-binding cassette domain-containing protein [Bryobacteraceae bacterium]